jgi:phosphoenolpyruvate-protein kinase (PTS system EI component)
MANLSLHSDIADAHEMKAEGVGLFRTEFEIIAKQRMFSEDELNAEYRQILESFGKETVFLRAFDLGSDKSAPFLNVPREENPSLGWRGSRLLLGVKDLFRGQARALARLSGEFDVHIMYPMIVDLDQFIKMRDMFNDFSADIDKGEVKHGVMFEIPSACLCAGEILQEADFGSVGSNDLTQYLFAVDRENERVAYDYNPDRPVFWKLMGQIAAAGRERGKPVSVCGEMAGEPHYVHKLMDAGINSVSVSPRRIPAVRLAAKEHLETAPTLDRNKERGTP